MASGQGLVTYEYSVVGYNESQAAIQEGRATVTIP
jgi:hypothetical protein